MTQQVDRRWSQLPLGVKASSPATRREKSAKSPHWSSRSRGFHDESSTENITPRGRHARKVASNGPKIFHQQSPSLDGKFQSLHRRSYSPKRRHCSLLPITTRQLVKHGTTTLMEKILERLGKVERLFGQGCLRPSPKKSHPSSL